MAVDASKSTIVTTVVKTNVQPEESKKTSSSDVKPNSAATDIRDVTETKPAPQSQPPQTQKRNRKSRKLKSEMKIWAIFAGIPTAVGVGAYFGLAAVTAPLWAGIGAGVVALASCAGIVALSLTGFKVSKIDP